MKKTIQILLLATALHAADAPVVLNCTDVHALSKSTLTDMFYGVSIVDAIKKAERKYGETGKKVTLLTYEKILPLYSRIYSDKEKELMILKVSSATYFKCLQSKKYKKSNTPK